MLQPNPEFSELKELITNHSPVTTGEIQTIVEEYFSTIEWSLLKEEWLKMSELQREALYSKLLVDIVSSTTAKFKTLDMALAQIETKKK